MHTLRKAIVPNLPPIPIKMFFVPIKIKPARNPDNPTITILFRMNSADIPTKAPQ